MGLRPIYQADKRVEDCQPMIVRQLVKYLSISTIGNWAQESTTTESKPHTVKVNGGDIPLMVSTSATVAEMEEWKPGSAIHQLGN